MEFFEGKECFRYTRCEPPPLGTPTNVVGFAIWVPDPRGILCGQGCEVVCQYVYM